MCDIDLIKLKNIVERNKINIAKKQEPSKNPLLIKLQNIAIKNTYGLEGIITNRMVGNEIQKYKDLIIQIDNGSLELKYMHDYFIIHPELLSEFIDLHNANVTCGVFENNNEIDTYNNIGISIKDDDRYKELTEIMQGLLIKIRKDLSIEKKELIYKIKKKWNIFMKDEKDERQYKKELNTVNKIYDEIIYEEERKTEYEKLYVK